MLHVSMGFEISLPLCPAIQDLDTFRCLPEPRAMVSAEHVVGAEPLSKRQKTIKITHRSLHGSA